MARGRVLAGARKAGAVTARDRRVLQDDGHRWVVVLFRLVSLWMRLHVPEERASCQDRQRQRSSGRSNQQQRQRQQQQQQRARRAARRDQQQHDAGAVELQFVLVRVGQASWGERRQPVGGGQAVHTAGVSVQEGCECKVLGVCGGS